MPNCQAKKDNRQPCKARAQAGSKFCFFHDPNARDQRREAQSKGGGKRTHSVVFYPPPSDFDLSDPHGVANALTWVANRVIRGELDSRTATAVGYLGDCALRAYNAGSIADRLEALERLQKAEPNWSPAPVDFEEEEMEPEATSAAEPDDCENQISIEDPPEATAYMETESARQASAGQLDEADSVERPEPDGQASPAKARLHPPKAPRGRCPSARKPVPPAEPLRASAARAPGATTSATVDKSTG
jgi:hypothetical protein